MKPHAQFAFDWPEMGGKQYQMVDPAGAFVVDDPKKIVKPLPDGSTITQRTADAAMLDKIDNDEGVQGMVENENCMSFYRGSLWDAIAETTKE